MAMASTSHVEETVDEHEEEDGPIPVAKLEVILTKIIINFIR